MWKNLKLTNFKSFREADIPLGPFTVIVGTNASGKSNIRDAFRFLHGTGLGSSLLETIGRKESDGQIIWNGIRGGTQEIAHGNAGSFACEATLQSGDETITHSIQVGVDNGRSTIKKERLKTNSLSFDPVLEASCDAWPDPELTATRFAKSLRATVTSSICSRRLG
jgi:AAA15 family ATPase/GTPase